MTDGSRQVHNTHIRQKDGRLGSQAGWGPRQAGTGIPGRLGSQAGWHRTPELNLEVHTFILANCGFLQFSTYFQTGAGQGDYNFTARGTSLAPPYT